MVNLNRNSEPLRVAGGWDPYDVWYFRVRSASLQLTSQRRARSSPRSPPSALRTRGGV